MLTDTLLPVYGLAFITKKKKSSRIERLRDRA